MLSALNEEKGVVRGCRPHLRDFRIYLRISYVFAVLKQTKGKQQNATERKFVTTRTLNDRGSVIDISVLTADIRTHIYIYTYTYTYICIRI